MKNKTHENPLTLPLRSLHNTSRNSKSRKLPQLNPPRTNQKPDN